MATRLSVFLLPEMHQITGVFPRKKSIKTTSGFVSALKNTSYPRVFSYCCLFSGQKRLVFHFLEAISDRVYVIYYPKLRIKSHCHCVPVTNQSYTRNCFPLSSFCCFVLFLSFLLLFQVMQDLFLCLLMQICVLWHEVLYFHLSGARLLSCGVKGLAYVSF